LTADEWFEGKDSNPKLIDLEVGFTAKAKKEFTPTAQPVAEKKSEPASPNGEKNVSPIFILSIFYILFFYIYLYFIHLHTYA
jgi:hypothetical protein